MPKYQYKALKDNTQLISGEVDAVDLKEARQKIIALGFTPTKVYTEEFGQSSVSSVSDIQRVSHGQKITFLGLEDKILFTSELEVLLSSGIPILEALNTIETNSPKLKLKVICKNLKSCILSGKTFAESLTLLYGKVFGPVYTALIKTGEDAGELEVTLSRMLYLLQKQDRIKGKIIGASIYPAILILMMTVLLILFSTLVFPKFMGMLAFNGAELPPLAALLYGICSFVGHFWWLIIIGICAMCGALSFLFQNRQFKSKWDDFILKVPVISDFIQYINLSNFMTVLHISYEAGLPIMSGLELSTKTVGNNTIKKKVFNALNLIRGGTTLSDAFRRVGVIPGALMTMIATGEKSGSLGKMLHDAAEVIDKKVDMALEALTKLFEPAIIIIIGGCVLFVALAFYQMYAGMLGSLF